MYAWHQYVYIYIYIYTCIYIYICIYIICRYIFVFCTSEHFDEDGTSQQSFIMFYMDLLWPSFVVVLLDIYIYIPKEPIVWKILGFVPKPEVCDGNPSFVISRILKDFERFRKCIESCHIPFHIAIYHQLLLFERMCVLCEDLTSARQRFFFLSSSVSKSEKTGINTVGVCRL